jgi:hypothetical protein
MCGCVVRPASYASYGFSRLCALCELPQDLWHSIWLNPVLWFRVSSATRDAWRQRMLSCARTHPTLTRDELPPVPVPTSTGCAGVQRVLDVLRRHCYFTAEPAAPARQRALYAPYYAELERPSHSVLLQVRSMCAPVLSCPVLWLAWARLMDAKKERGERTGQELSSCCVVLCCVVALHALLRQLLSRGGAVRTSEVRALLLAAHDCSDDPMQQVDLLNLLLALVLDPAHTKAVRIAIVQLHNDPQPSNCQGMALGLTSSLRLVDSSPSVCFCRVV